MTIRDIDPTSEPNSAPHHEGTSDYWVSSAWLVSLLLHLVFLLFFSLLSPQADRLQRVLLIATPQEEQPKIEDLSRQEFHFDPTPREQIGGNELGGLPSELPGGLPTPELPQWTTLELPSQDRGEIAFREFIEAATGVDPEVTETVRGTAGVGVTRAEGAIDRITHEILLSLEERNTLVVWFFDQSGSLASQREAILARFGRIYEELGVIQTSEHPAARRSDPKPLLTSVVAFGREVLFPLDKPSDDLPQIREAVAHIALDDSGIEQVFTAIRAATMRFRKYRVRNATTGEAARNVMFIVFTDEAGDDQDQLDPTVQLCRRLAIPVYVVGVPAPFGRRETLVKWVDPDPQYDQRPQWGRVHQGPETLLPERVKIHFANSAEQDDVIDSGFGPFALTRLCYETGGIYFAVHPNRTTTRNVSRGETAVYSAHLRTFFDEDAMRRYRPDYVSAQEYFRRVKENRARSSLVQAAEQSWITPLEQPRVRFVVRDEAGFASELTEAQKSAAKLEPATRPLYELLKQGESDRQKETVPRWQAGYDLAMGRVLAVRVRSEAYNEMLARAKRGMKFANPANNTWMLIPSSKITAGSQLENLGEQALDYLHRVVKEHPGTPWAWLAQRELSQPMGWEWKEGHTPLPPPATQVVTVDNPPAAPADDQPQIIRRPPPRRPPPRL